MKKRFLLFVIFLVILGFHTVFKPASAVVTTCSASVSPSSVERDTSNNFTFTINNTDSVTYNWIKITRPSASVWTINSGSATGWSASANSDNVTFTGGSLAASGSLSVAVNATAANFLSDSTAWTVQVSDNGGGATFNCTGSLGTSITNPPADQPPEISAITVSDVTSSSVKITWTTNENATSVIDYGTTGDYGSTKSDSTPKTSHSLMLEGLTANTTYHFNIKGVDSGGNTGEVGDNTFVAAKASSTATTTTTTTLVTPTPSPTPAPDTTKPFVTVSTDFSKPFEVSPQISGKASDNKAVSKLEYSLDAGRNWLAVDNVVSLGKTSTSFNFNPALLDDGNYNLKIRATDSSNNIGISKLYTLVIDRLFPQTSGVLFSLGPQVLNPRQNGSILTMAGQPLKITLSEVGGSTKVNILAFNLADKSFTTYSLTKNPDNGLWSGVLPLKGIGEYQLKFSAVDGAGNKTETDLNKVIAVASGKINTANGNLFNTKLTVYYQEPVSKRWQIWDGGAYSQKNPLKTDKNGNYSLFLPAGKYYLQVDAYGYQTLNSEFFTLDKPQPINANFVLKESKLIFSLGFIKLYWPDFSTLTVPFKNNLPNAQGKQGSLIGKQLPFFSLTNGFSSDTLRGKPAILTFLNTWSPSAAEQISILNNFSKNKNFNSATIIEGEKSSKVFVFKKRGGYNLPMYTDPDATLIPSYGLSVLPTSYFIDRKGIVRDVIVGVLSEKEIEEKLLNISE